MNDAINNNKKALLRLLLLLSFFVFLYYIREALSPIIISLFLFYILNPFVSFLSNKRPKGLQLPIQLAIVTVFMATICLLYLFFKFIIPPLSLEFKNFAQNIPQYLISAKNTMDTLKQWYSGFALPSEVRDMLTQNIQEIINIIFTFAEQMAKGLLSVVTKFIQIIVIPILTYYFLKDKQSIRNGLIDLIPEKSQPKAVRILSRINTVLNSYVKGVGILCLIIGVASTIGLFILGVKYYLILGLIAGLTEAIPFIGPWIGAIPAIIIAFIASPILAVQVALLYILIQTIENHFLVPKILGDKLELHPTAVIISILILGKLLGTWGLFFAAPITAILKILYQEIQE